MWLSSNFIVRIRIVLIILVVAVITSKNVKDKINWNINYKKHAKIRLAESQPNDKVNESVNKQIYANKEYMTS